MTAQFDRLGPVWMCYLAMPNGRSATTYSHFWIAAIIKARLIIWWRY